MKPRSHETSKISACESCQKTYLQPRTGRPRRYCSSPCRQRGYRARPRFDEMRLLGIETEPPLLPKDPDEIDLSSATRYRPCPVDGHPVDTLQGKRGPAPVYCSIACRKRAHRARKRAEATTVEIPPCMRNRARWIRHDEQKRPLTIHGWYASVRKPSTWTTWSRARDSEVGVGMGFVLGDGIGCIDLDDVIDGRGRVAPWAAAYVDRFRGRAILIERSRSGRGIHIFLRMEEAKGRRIREPGQKIEIYSWGRYIAITGDRV